MLERQVFFHGVYYIGSPAELEAAGLCSQDALPGQPGMPKVQITQRSGRRFHGRKYTVSRVKKGVYQVYLSKAELEWRLSGSASAYMKNLTDAARVIVEN